MAKVLVFFIFVNILYFAYGKKLENDKIRQAVEELQAKVHFETFIEQYEKKYDTEEEYNKRFQIFKENLENIDKQNAESTDAVYGVNKFSDLRFEEFLHYYTCLKFDNETVGTGAEYVPTGNAPAELDYRKLGLVTRVKNQGRCGSCYIFSAMGLIEGQYAKKHKHLVSLSEQQALDCDSLNDGCQGGHMERAVDSIKLQGGSMAEADYTPYKAKQMKCHTDKSKIIAQVSDGERLEIMSESQLADALAKIGPLSIGISVCSTFQNYHGGILKVGCDKEINHGVVLVGYGSENAEDFWIIKNSWGSDWGEKGYIRVKKGKNLISIGQYTVTADVA